MYYASNYMVYGDQEQDKRYKSEPEGFQGALESGGTYFLAIGLLSLPLLFSFGTKILGEEGLGETSIKQSFYMQCYYFSPVTAVFWASIYSLTLYTIDIYFLAELMPIIIFALIVIWFLLAENNAIMVERGVSKGRAWGVLFVLIVGLAIGSFIIYFIITDLDFLRRYAIMLYPIIGTAVFIAYFVRRRRERRLLKQKSEEPVNPEP
jgi:peptidoglycan/LPS O-acetylase OafA/YrhL